MKRILILASFGALVLAAIAPFTTAAQTYPSRPLRIVTSEAGGGNDILARALAPSLRTQLGQNVIIENRPAGVIPGQVVSRAQPDGYTLLLYTGSLWTAPFFQQVPYDPIRDFTPISLIASTPSVLVIHPSVPANSVKELIAYARARPDVLNYAYTSIGAPNHLAPELFKTKAAINLVGVPYRGTAPALTDLIAGRVQIMFAVAAAAMPHIKAARLKALGVTSAQPSALAPGIPTVAAGGLPGYETAALYGVFAPSKTPVVITRKLGDEIVQTLEKAEVRERVLAAGLEPIGSSPEAFAAKIKADRTVVGELVRNATLKTP